MNKLNYDELKHLIESLDLYDMGPAEWLEDDVADLLMRERWRISDVNLSRMLDQIGPVTCVQHGSTADDASYHSVYQFLDHDVYIKFTGWWSSYDGNSFNGMYQVVPEERIITAYVGVDV